jgi:hypothetical protein
MPSFAGLAMVDETGYGMHFLLIAVCVTLFHLSSNVRDMWNKIETGSVF